jgi:hypothetical protein
MHRLLSPPDRGASMQAILNEVRGAGGAERDAAVRMALSCSACPDNKWFNPVQSTRPTGAAVSRCVRAVGTESSIASFRTRPALGMVVPASGDGDSEPWARRLALRQKVPRLNGRVSATRATCCAQEKRAAQGRALFGAVAASVSTPTPSIQR